MDKTPITAQFVDNFYPVVDGVVRVVDNYAAFLNERSYTSVFVPTQDKNYKDDFPYKVLRAKSLPFFIREYTIPVASFTKSIKEELKSKKFDIYHAHSPFFLGHFALKQAKKSKVKVIGTFHSKFYDDALQITKSKFLANILKNYVLHFFNKCDAVWACSNGTANTLREYGYKGDIFVAENGTDYVYPQNADELRKAGKEKWKLDDNVPTILFVGHQIWQKNLKLVLDTASELYKRNYRFRMLIVGTGYAEKEISAYAEKLELPNNVVTFIRNTQNKEQLMSIELASDLFFFPSAYDNAPLVVREAAAMKLPSLLLEGTNAAEPIVDGENGFLCKNDPVYTADIIEKIFTERDKLDAIKEKARNTLGRTWEDIMPEIIAEYNRILNK